MRGVLLSLLPIGLLFAGYGAAGCGAARAPSAKADGAPRADASAAPSASSAVSAAPAAPAAIVRTPRSAPWESVPMVVVGLGSSGKLEATVPLVALEDGVAAIDVVLSEVTDDPGDLVDLACTDGFVAREIDRSIFEAAASAKGPLSIVVELDLSGAPASTAAPSARRFASRACARDGAGAIEGTADAAALVVSTGATWVEDPVVSTPSGPIVEGLVRRGHEVIGWDATLAAPVLATIVRTKSGGAKNVSFEVDGRSIAAPSSRTFFLPASGEWRAASALQPGDRVRAIGGGTAAITRAAEPSEDLEVVRIETDSNGAFIDGLLTSDGSLAKPKPEKKSDKAAKKKSDDPIDPPAARVAYAPATETARWIAAPQSWDCQLDTRLEIDALPPGATAVALVIADHEAAPGARDEATCMEAAVVREIPASFVEATHAQGGRYAITLGEDEVECDAGYALSVCVRGADGRLSPVADARYGVAGASCFVGATLIATPGGDVAIESLKRGDVVVALGPGVGGATTSATTGSVGRAHVTHVKAIERDDVGEVVLSNGVTLRATKDHPFFLSDGSLVKAGELGRGVALVSRDGGAVTVVSAGPFDQKARVFDLSVDGPHDYFAGGVLVHNY